MISNTANMPTIQCL